MMERDWPRLLGWNQDPVTIATWDDGHTAPWSLRKLQRVYRAISRNAFMFVIEIGRQAIGKAWLQRMNLPEILRVEPRGRPWRIDLSIGGPRFRGKGLGTEVISAISRFGFVKQHAEAIFACHVNESNPAGSKAFGNNGFVIWGAAAPEQGPPVGGRPFHMILTRGAWSRGGHPVT